MPTATLSDGAVDYQDLGDPAAPAVVFVHGLLVDGTLWRGVAERVAAAGFRAVVPDLPIGAHRRPMAPGADLSPRGLARLLLAFLEHLDLTGACLVANDTGGAVTQFALDIDPGRIGRVVFTNCDTAGRFPPPPFDVMVRVGALPGALPVAFALTRLGPLGRLGYGPLLASPVDRDQARAWLTPGRTQAAIRRDLRRFLRAVDPDELIGVTERLGRFAGPVLVLWGTEDRFFRLEDGRGLAARFPTSRLVEVPGARTFVPLDRPDVVVDEVVAFLRQPAGAGGGNGADGADDAGGGRPGAGAVRP